MPPQATVINFQRTTGKAGFTFVVQGYHFVGTTAVAVNGTAATFKMLTANFVR
ncbi:MAG TPA: hypothetical protein VJP02_14410 [Candidatus Sulfotelmatobacter sp.]|nr:hypothetical protein [Candidatus Sulfotelmatobacter sp.]